MPDYKPEPEKWKNELENTSKRLKSHASSCKRKQTCWQAFDMSDNVHVVHYLCARAKKLFMRSMALKALIAKAEGK